MCLRLMLYIDMDSFFASCELVRHPELRGKALIVGTNTDKDKMKGVVQACSYEAKKLGIHSAMPTRMAYAISQKLSYLQSDWDYYEKISTQIMGILSESKLKAEQYSIDEAVMEGEFDSYDEALDLGREIKRRINEKLQLPCTIGISEGKTFAKMVCDDAKPDGLKLVKREDVKDFLKGKDVEKIVGVGRKTADRLNAIGIKTIGDMAKANPARLTNAVGSFGVELYKLANGEDDSRVVEHSDILSISRERTLPENTLDMVEIEKMLDKLVDEVMGDVRKQGVSFKTVTVKARYNDFTDKLKGKSLPNYSDSAEVLKRMSHSLIREIVAEKPVRKVGVRVSSFSSGKGQKKLF